MYPEDHHNQEMMQQMRNNAPTMMFPPNTSPTYGMVQCHPDFEPIFVPIPPKGGSVLTTPEDEQTHSFEFTNPTPVPSTLIHQTHNKVLYT